MPDVQPIPDGYHSVTPYLVLRGAADGLAFYQKAFGATELYRLDGPGGSVMHAELQIGDSRLMLTEENPEMGAQSPAALGGTPLSLLIYLDDVDAAYARAIEAGCTSLKEPEDMFWGDRFCSVQDPFGHQWSLATHVEDVDPDEMGRRAQQAFAPAAE